MTEQNDPSDPPGQAFSAAEVSDICAAWSAGSPPSSAARCLVLDAAESTQDEARKLLESPQTGASVTYDIAVASTQTKGRGTRGRTWSQDSHDDISFSFVASPLGRFDPMLLPMLVSVAVRQSVLDSLRAAQVRACEERLRLKWPNDLLFDSRKLAGILIESYDRERWIVGVGININRRAFTDELREIATSVALIVESTVDRCEMLCKTLASLRELLAIAADHPAGILSLYESGLGLVGVEVDLALPKRQVRGELANVSPEAVTLRDGRSFAPGEVSAIRAVPDLSD